ncbi:E2/UBC family protein [Haloarculaceae archaeon H-GB2-1]|nr:E2/UBC family protein [Haloarculaceae archaeon H-GB2-1]
MNEVIQTDVDELRENYTVDVDDDPDDPKPQKFTHVIVRDKSVPSDAYNKDTTDVLLRVPDDYPNEPLDWVYVDKDLRLESGGKPKKHNTDRVPGWLALSYHPKNLRTTSSGSRTSTH